jgi:hypothetical protein
MNGDGKIDLVCPINGNGFFKAPCPDLDQRRRGQFQHEHGCSLGSGFRDTLNYPDFVTAADFDGDGNMDIAVSCYRLSHLSRN